MSAVGGDRVRAIDNPRVPAVSPAIRGTRRASTGRRPFRHAVGSCLVALVSLVVCWWAFVEAVDTSPLIARSPSDVFRSLTTRPGAGELRHRLATNLVTTLGHAAVGLVAGLVGACILAAAAVTSRACAAVIKPAAIAMRSTPLIALAPILGLIFGRGIVVVAAMGGAVTIVPTLYHLMRGLDAVPAELLDVVRAGGGRRRHQLAFTQIPTAAPSLALSLRVAAPGAIVGALLAEWLATGNGLGREMIRGKASFDYTTVWAATALVAVAGMAAYGVAAVIESRVIAHWAPERRQP